MMTEGPRKLDYDLIAKLRRARLDIKELLEERDYLRDQLDKVKAERDLVISIMADLSKGYHA